MAGIDGLVTSTFHAELCRVAGIKRVPEDAGQDFWRRELPELAMAGLVERGIEPADFLILDEVQDIARTEYIDVLDLMVDGGFNGGRVLCFGDFERQAIYENERGKQTLLEYAPNIMSFKLFANCRNLPRIGFQVNLLSRFQPGYQSDQFRRLDDGVDPTVWPYSGGAAQSALLLKAVRSLQEDGFDLDEILVLSPLAGTATAQVTTDPWLRANLETADGTRPRRGRLRYSTIQAFKGLEAPAIIVTDVSNTIANYESLLYVGLTRATDRLFVLVESGALRAALGGTK